MDEEAPAFFRKATTGVPPVLSQSRIPTFYTVCQLRDLVLDVLDEA